MAICSEPERIRKTDSSSPNRPYLTVPDPMDVFNTAVVNTAGFVGLHVFHASTPGPVRHSVGSGPSVKDTQSGTVGSCQADGLDQAHISIGSSTQDTCLRLCSYGR